MNPRTRARTPCSIASNQSSKSKTSAATAASFVVSLVMAWSPHSSASTPESFGLGNPETTPTQFQPPPRRDPAIILVADIVFSLIDSRLGSIARTVRGASRRQGIGHIAALAISEILRRPTQQTPLSLVGVEDAPDLGDDLLANLLAHIDLEILRPDRVGLAIDVGRIPEFGVIFDRARKRL